MMRTSFRLIGLITVFTLSVNLEALSSDAPRQYFRAPPQNTKIITIPEDAGDGDVKSLIEKLRVSVGLAKREFETTVAIC